MSELIKSLSIENLVNQRAAIESLLETAHKALKQANEIAERAGMKGVNRFFEGRRGRDEDFSFAGNDGVKKAMKSLDSSAWKHLMEESGMLSLMDSETKSKWYSSLEDGKFPELTLANIRATFEDIHAGKVSMFEQGVINCYKKLSWNYKTNNPVKFDKKMIVDYFISSYGSLTSRTLDEIADLERIFFVMEGMPAPDYRNSIRQKLYEAKNKGNEYEDEYFKMKWYKKGSCHIVFKRLDLVKRMNQILAKYYPNALAHAA